MVDIQADISLLVENDYFLFDEQVIQDERLLNLEDRMLSTENNVDSMYLLRSFLLISSLIPNMSSV